MNTSENLVRSGLEYGENGQMKMSDLQNILRQIGLCIS